MSDVSFIKHAVAFAHHIPDNKKLTPFHISLYYALFHEWNDAYFKPEFPIFRNDIMECSRIGSANTYRRCLNDLNRWNYLNYLPSQSRHEASRIEMHRFDNAKPKTIIYITDYKEIKSDADADVKQIKDDLNQVKRDTASDASGDLPVRPFTYNTNNTDITDTAGEGRPAPTPDPIKNDFLMSAVKKNENGPGGAPGNLEEVVAFFVSIRSTAFEAEKFYYHFKSIGWLVRGQPMVDWQAAAEKWLRNPDKSKLAGGSKPTPGALQTPGARGVKKDYTKPL